LHTASTIAIVLYYNIKLRHIIIVSSVATKITLSHIYTNIPAQMARGANDAVKN